LRRPQPTLFPYTTLFRSGAIAHTHAYPVGLVISQVHLHGDRLVCILRALGTNRDRGEIAAVQQAFVEMVDMILRVRITRLERHKLAEAPVIKFRLAEGHLSQTVTAGAVKGQ